MVEWDPVGVGIMFGRSTLLRASIICILLWAFLFGVLIDAEQGANAAGCQIIVAGTVKNITTSSSPDVNSLTIWDGSLKWHFDFNRSIASPEVGDLVVVFLSVSGGINMTVTGIKVL